LKKEITVILINAQTLRMENFSNYFLEGDYNFLEQTVNKYIKLPFLQKKNEKKNFLNVMD